METVQSADGTTIAWEREGTGPTMVIVTGTMNTARSMAPLAKLLAPDFSVVSYDRRGRGASGDTAPWAIEREIEDLQAVIAEVGGPVLVYGHSAGGALSLETVLAGAPVTKLAVYEPPYNSDPATPKDPRAIVAPIEEALGAGDPALAVSRYLQYTGLGNDQVDYMSHSPFWPGMVAVAATIPYDVRISGDGVAPSARLASIAIPLLAVDGSATGEWAARAADSVASAVAGSRRETLQGQDHNPAPRLLAPLLKEFFAA